MNVCAQCGHELGIGRFCVNCGHPVGEPADPAFARTDTAERPAVVAADPAPPPTLPPPDATTRFPLFADEVAPTPRASRRGDRRRRTWWPWPVGAAVMLLVAVLGWSLMFGDEDETSPTVGEESTASPKEPRPTETKPTKPDKSDAPEEPSEPADPTALAPQSAATVSSTAPPSTDYSGNQVSYEARHMLDGVPATCWRMPGDGTGETIVITLPQESTLTSVGLVNGYAKTAIDDSGNELDWYAGNRRVLAVEWSFDDGTTVTQDLGETRELQRLDLDDVTTSTISLTLVEVSDPGTGPSRRDYTAISEIAAVGSSAR